MKKLLLPLLLLFSISTFGQTVFKIGQTDTTSAGAAGLVSKGRLATNLGGYQKTVTLTVTGASGASTLVSNTLNIPTYTIAGLGGVPTTTTVNGKALSGNITLGLASSDFANQGTTTGVLHGNAAGNPAFGQIVIADLSATGTPSGTTFLRGDNTWAVPLGLGTTNFVYSEVPSGTVNGSNVTFTLANTPTAGTVLLYKNGQRLKITTDYTISTNTITMGSAPLTLDLLLADYQK